MVERSEIELEESKRESKQERKRSRVKNLGYIHSDCLCIRGKQYLDWFSMD